MRRVPCVVLLVVGCQQEPEQSGQESSPPPAPVIASSTAEPQPSVSLSGLPFTQRPFAELKPKLSNLTPADACFVTCRVTLVCRPCEASESAELSKRIRECRERCNADKDAWIPRLGQARVCLTGPDCDAYGQCMRGSRLAPSATP